MNINNHFLNWLYGFYYPLSVGVKINYVILKWSVTHSLVILMNAF